MVFLDFFYEIYVNTLGDLDGHTCNSEMTQNYDKIFYEHTAKYNEAHLRCSVPFHPPIASQLTGRTIEICNNSEAGKQAYGNWVHIANTQTPNNKPCAGMDIFLGPPIYDNDRADNESSIRIYMKSDIKVKSVIIYYDFTTLVADVGGYIGMFLGVSLVDITIMCNTALLKIVTMKVKQKYEHMN